MRSGFEPAAGLESEFSFYSAFSPKLFVIALYKKKGAPTCERLRMIDKNWEGSYPSWVCLGAHPGTTTPLWVAWLSWAFDLGG